MTFSSTLTIDQAQDEIFDCVIVGSGLAGSAAAVHLAQTGLILLFQRLVMRCSVRQMIILPVRHWLPLLTCVGILMRICSEEAG